MLKNLNKKIQINFPKIDLVKFKYMSTVNSKIRELISENKLEKALNELLNWSTGNNDSDLRDNIILLKSRYERVKQQERLGIVNYTEALREQSFIGSTLLDLIQRIKHGSEEKIRNEETSNLERKTILFLASAPTDEAKLQLEKEFVKISTSLQEGIIEYRLVAEWAITPNALQHAILKHKPNFIHFSGHGEGGDQLTGGIILNDTKSKAKMVTGMALENMFRIFSRKFKIEIVLLNSCYSKDQATGISKHIPYVIGMNEAIEDDSAIEFSTGFYRGLADEEDIEFAFDLAVNMIQLEGLGGDNVPQLLRCLDKKN